MSTHRPIGVLTRPFTGWWRDIFHERPDFCVDFPLELPAPAKAALVGTAFLVSYMYYEIARQDFEDLEFGG